MSDRISAELIERIRERLKDDWRRTGDGDWQRTPGELKRKWEAPSIAGALLHTLVNSLPAVPPDLEPLKTIEPLSERAVAKVEKDLGFALPPQLRQLYLEIGDGGFGPWFGIRRLSNWAKDYSKLRADLLAERGREWPEALLPIVYLNGKRICVDRKSGVVLLWTKPPKKTSEKKWLASFIPQSPSVESWLERWVDTPTVSAGGPDGGWSPPEEEMERREAAVREIEAKREAQAEKARNVVVAELDALADDLLERVRAKALDPKRRTYLASTAERSTPFGLDDLEDQLAKSADVLGTNALTGLAGMLSNIRRLAPLAGGLPGLNVAMGPGGGMVMMGSGAAGKLGEPVTDAALAHADQQLGFRLPEPLRQLLRIADGGFGPGGGLLSTARTLSRYRKLNAKPQGPGGELWPAKLLPIFEADEEIVCLDLETGAITSYDPSRMADIHGGYWRRSFAKQASSLSELMENWLGETTFEEDIQPGSKMMREYLEKRPPEEDPGEIAVAYFAKMTPEDRANAGLPEDGWEDELRRRHRGPW